MLKSFNLNIILIFFLLVISSCKNERKEIDKGLLNTNSEKEDKRPVFKQNHVFSPSLVEYYLQQVTDSVERLSSTDKVGGMEKIALTIYKLRNYKPVWELYEKRSNLPVQYLDLLDTVYFEGLDAEDYAFEDLKKYRQQVLYDNNEKGHADRVEAKAFNAAIGDFHYTVSFLKLLHHLKRGKINPNDLGLNWLIAKNTEVNSNYLISLAHQQNNLSAALDTVSSKHEHYYSMKKLLKQYYELNKNQHWKAFPPGNVLSLGSVSDRVLILRQNLCLTQDLDCYNLNDPENSLFDKELQNAVSSFQSRHRLQPTGIVDERFIKEMNIPINERIKLISNNLERLRWLPDTLGKKYILINIPDFKLKLFNNDEEILEMKIIVGKTSHSTPVFSDKVEYVTFSPYWNVPQSIAQNELLPKIKKNERFLFRNRFEVIDSWDTNAIFINPRDIDWEVFDKDYFPYKLRQKPGPWNALGKVKFMFPNDYDIYIHDTPEKHLFLKQQRDFSSGCIRVEKPFELAKFLLPELSAEEILTKMDGFEEENITLKNPVPVHIVYLTVLVDNKGRAIFREDLYGMEEKLNTALRKEKTLKNTGKN